MLKKIYLDRFGDRGVGVDTLIVQKNSTKSCDFSFFGTNFDELSFFRFQLVPTLLFRVFSLPFFGYLREVTGNVCHQVFIFHGYIRLFD